jgi:polysaccharide export outer membrane protein
MKTSITTILLVTAALCLVVPVSAQQTGPRTALINGKPPVAPPPAPVPNYVIGTDDVLTISVWREKDFSGDVIVRPDGKITPPGVGNDIVAAGLTVDELKVKVIEELKKNFDSPDVSVAVKTINSRWVYITGAVAKPGRYPLTGTMTVLQLIANAGGLQEFADRKNIMLLSASLKGKDGSPLSYKINYEELQKGKNPAKNNIELRPGDQVIVP